MKKVFSKIKNILYVFGIILNFGLIIIQFYDWFELKNKDWYTLLLIVICFYSLCIMISKIVKSRSYLERIRSIIKNNPDSKSKIRCIEYEMFDIDAYLNDK